MKQTTQKTNDFNCKYFDLILITEYNCDRDKKLNKLWSICSMISLFTAKDLQINYMSHEMDEDEI